MRFDRKRFFDGYRERFPGKLPVGRVRGLQEVLGFIEEDEAITDLRWAAYMLATTKHETADTYHPIVERGPRAYFDKYEPGTRIGKRLGNERLGDGYRLRGRGYVQITGLSNYVKMGDLLGVDLYADPDLALRPEIAYKIMSVGMRLGTFTGKKLADYIPEGGPADYFHARKIINGLDRAALIADYAWDFEEILGAAALP